MSSDVNSLEIYTTDNHYVNASNLDTNPLGRNTDPVIISDLIKRTVAMAKNDITEVRIGMKTAHVKVKMGEENTYERLIDSAFNSLRMAKYTIILTIPSSVAASIAVFRFTIPII